jgi:hypothetical protein
LNALAAGGPEFVPVLLTPSPARRDNHRVAAHSAIGFGDPETKARKRPSTDDGAFFMPASSGAHARQFMAGGAGRPQGLPVLGPVRQPRVARHLAVAVIP